MGRWWLGHLMHFMLMCIIKLSNINKTLLCTLTKITFSSSSCSFKFSLPALYEWKKKKQIIFVRWKKFYITEKLSLWLDKFFKSFTAFGVGQFFPFFSFYLFVQLRLSEAWKILPLCNMNCNWKRKRRRERKSSALLIKRMNCDPIKTDVKAKLRNNLIKITLILIEVFLLSELLRIFRLRQSRWGQSKWVKKNEKREGGK